MTLPGVPDILVPPAPAAAGAMTLPEAPTSAAPLRFDFAEDDATEAVGAPAAAGHAVDAMRLGDLVVVGLPESEVAAAARAPAEAVVAAGTEPGVVVVAASPAGAAEAEAIALAVADWASSAGASATVDRAYDGSGTAVVVVDTGFSPYYDMSSIRAAYDFSGGNDPWAHQWTLASHGSWVAEVATDVARDTDIIHLKVFGDGAAGASLLDVEEALQWVVREGERFDTVAVNLSLGYGNATAATSSLLSDEIAALKAQDVMTVVAAGNAGRAHADGVNVLAADPNAVAVSAVDRGDRFTDWSQTSEDLTDIAALGAGVRVDTIWGWGLHVSGTSFAAPYVAGTTAVLQEAARDVLDRRLGVDEVLMVMQEAGRDVVDEAQAEGYRVADADAAVEWLLDHQDVFDAAPDLLVA